MGDRVSRRGSNARRVGIAALVASVLAMLVPVLVPVAQAALPSRIVGYVENAAGMRLPGIVVEVYSNGSGPSPLPIETTTDTAGEFAIDVTDTPPGGSGYSVAFTDPSDALGYQVFDRIFIQPGYDEIIGVILRPGGRIEGTVTNEGGGPVTGLCVRVSAYSTGLAPDLPATVDCDLTDGYESPALATGAYDVSVTDSSGVFRYSQFVELVAPATVVRDIVIPAPVVAGTARVSGQILASDSGEPLDGCVQVYDSNDLFVEFACTDGTGTYQTGYFDPGTYRFSAFTFNSLYTAQPLTDVVVVAGDQTVNLAATKVATIEGTVTAPGGALLAGVQVRVCSVSSPFSCAFARGTTAADGTYEVSVQDFVGQAVAVAFTGSNLVWEWHSNVAFSSADGFIPPAGATTVIPAASTATVINAELDQIAPSAISGTITDSATDLKLPGVAVTIAKAGTNFPQYFTGTTTGPDGTYTVGGLEAGDYLVRAATFGYQSERYDDLRNGPGAPVVVTVGASATATGIDFDLDPQGVIEGRVTTDLDPISPYVTDFCVTATPDSGLFAPVSTCRLLGTTYRFSKLPSGTYTLRFTSDDYATQTIPGVVVTTPGTTFQNIQLARLAVLSGTVTDNATPGAPVEATICTENVDFTLVRCGTSAANGTYAFTVLPGTLGVRAQAAAYRTEWYLESATAPGTPIVVGSADVPNINFTLEPRPSISGRVTFDGLGLCTQVALLDPTTGFAVTSTFTSCATGATRGSYTVYTEPGDYKVRFGSTFDRTYLFQYWDAKSDIALADVIGLDPGEVVTGVDAVLVESPEISGVVTEDGTGDPLGNVSVVAYDQNGVFVSSDFTNVAGQYELAVPLGTFDVRFQRTGYRTEWFDNQTSQSTATPVVVGGLGASASASLFPLRRIAGVVTAEGSNLPLQSVQVEAIVPSTSFSSVTAFTGPDGSYDLYVEPGTWLVKFDGRISNFVVEYYDDAVSIDEATLVDVTLADDDTVDAQLELGGSIGGSVVGQFGEATSACVYAHAASPTFPQSGTLSRCGFASYQIRGVPAGTYRVFASALAPEYGDEWYDDASSYAAATDVVVTPGTASTANFPLDPAGQSISGQVVDELGVGVAGVKVSVSPGPVVETDSGGFFEVSGLMDRPDGYLVWFAKDGFVSEYYDNSQFFPTPVPVMGFPVDLGQIELATAPVTVSGTITELGSGGAVPASPVCVEFSPVLDNGFGGYATGLSYVSCADETGSYSVALPEGPFVVYLYGQVYPSPYIRDTPFDIGAPFEATAPSEILNLEIQRGSVFTGRVVQVGTSLGLPSVSVEITPVGGLYPVAWGFTDSLGFIKTEGVVDGEYSVRFVNSAGRYISAYLGGALIAPGDTVMVAGGDVDLGTVELSLGSLITGTITDDLANPVQGCVTVTDQGTGEPLTSGCSGPDGAYATAGLPNGTYDATASAAGFGSQTVAVVIAGGDVVQNFVLSAPLPLGPVQNLVATPGNQSVSLTWSPPTNPGAGVIDYNVLVDFGFGLNFYDSTGGATSYTVEFLDNGVSYDFAVVAVDSLGAEAQSATVAAVPNPQPPGQPTAVQAVAGTGQVTVSWTAPDDAGSPLIDSRVQVFKNGAWVWGATAILSSTSATVLGLDGGVEYSFRVRSQNVAGWGPWSSVATATPSAPVASAPTVVQNVTTLAGAGAVIVSWDAPADLGGAPIIDTRVQVFKDGAWKWGATAAGSATSATVVSLVGGTEYQFRVRTQNSAGWSPWSSPVAETPTAATVSAPGAIEDLSAFGGFGSGEVDVFWNNPLDDGGEAVSDTRVQVFKGGKWVWGATALGGSTFATVTSLNSGETYSFRARTRNSAGWGPWSAVTTATAT